MREGLLRIAVAQINCTVGDLDGNAAKIKDYTERAEGLGADIVVFPELAVTGYPPEDLLNKPKFIRDNLAKLRQLLKYAKDIVVVAGFVDSEGKELYNAAAIIYRGRLKGVYRKTHLPNYGVFDEKRYFAQGVLPGVFRYSDFVFGVNICEDIWHLEGPLRLQAKLGARLIININSSPYYAGKVRERENIIRKQAKYNRVSIVYANLVGGQDELVFDGQSMVADEKGKIIARAQAFKEEMLVVDLQVPSSVIKAPEEAISITDRLPFKNRPVFRTAFTKPLRSVVEIYRALLSGLKDYVRKNGFSKVVIGLSGGIDSSLVAALAADALGAENVTGVFMPSRYSSEESKADAAGLARKLGVKLFDISIEPIYSAYLSVLKPYFARAQENIAEENLQARIRGNILMALSNKFGWLVLTTGNKSEMSTGYATLYGDMAGGFAVIKDVPKQLVYELCRYRNSLSLVIPKRVLVKEPTAELKPNQKDRDTLPPYSVLDRILKAYVEEDKDSGAIISSGFSSKTVSYVLGLVDKSEYKRRQSPPGIKITPKAFGRDRRMPITNKYRG